MNGDTTTPVSRIPSLVAAVGSRACAVPSSFAIETMRPLPVEALPAMPPFVLGLAIIRGSPTPVVHAGRLLQAADAETIGRWVTLQVGQRKLALAVSAVLGICELASDSLNELPSILGPESAELIEAVGRLDARLLVLLRATRILPEPVWNSLAARVEGADGRHP